MSSFFAPLRKFLLARRLARGRLVFPIYLRHNSVYVFPTRQGFVFFALLLAILFGSLNHNNNLGFLLTFLLGGLALVSIFYTYRNITGLSLLSAKTRPVFAGQAAQFVIQVKPPDRDQYGVTFYFDHGQKTTVNLTAKSKSFVTIPHETVGRGVLSPSQLYVSTTYPLGLFRSWSVLFVDASCLVYPKPISGPMVIDHSVRGEENEGETGGEGVDDFAGLGVYQPGVPLQRISWKTYSRGQGLYVKEFEGQQGSTLYFDPDVLGGKDLEFKLSRISHMILKAEAMHISYGLKIGGRIIEPGLGGSHKRNCLRALATIGK